MIFSVKILLSLWIIFKATITISGLGTKKNKKLKIDIELKIKIPSKRKSVNNLRFVQILFPQIDGIENSDFCKELAKLKEEKLWLTPVFINEITKHGHHTLTC